jgi:signal transduction histidine kinase
MQYLATYLIFIAVVARAIGWNMETAPIPVGIWIMLAIFGSVLFTQQPLTRRFPWYPRLYALVQSVLVLGMLYRAPSNDFLPLLLLPLSFQVVQFFHSRIGFIWIGGFILAILAMALFGMEWEAGLTLVLVGSGACLLMGSFAHLISRTEGRRRENQHLLGDLQQAYHQLKASAARAEELAAAEERHRLTRELHDSLTQTLFSMNLAVQAAQLSARDAPAQAESHLSRLQSLSRSAAHEVQSLTGQVAARSLDQGGLAAALRQLADERLAQDGLQVTLEVNGNRQLPTAVEANLYRIAQEALNNITRHSGVRAARLRLCLESPAASLDVQDAGCGFDTASPGHSAGFGLAGMAERAAEIGWQFEVRSQAGQGTRIYVEERRP